MNRQILNIDGEVCSGNKQTEVGVFFSIVIPVQKINDYIFETCLKLKELEKTNFEILIFPDEVEKGNDELGKRLGAKIIASGRVSPAVKRDMAIEHARGNILAFIDDDAYPESDWLNIAERYLSNDDSVAAIGGPQLTPHHDSFWQKVSGAVFLSPLSGSALIRYWPGKRIEEVDDWPTVNFLVKKEDFIKAGGFDSHYWPGEDTKLCLDITKGLRKKILYVPDLIVYHHRRAGLGNHLRQIGNYGLHRGYFAKVFPETSMRLIYFIPSLFVLFIFAGILISLFDKTHLQWFLSGVMLYLFTVLATTVSICKRTGDFALSMATIPYLVFTHLWYGIRFIQGFVLTKKLKSKLGK